MSDPLTAGRNPAPPATPGVGPAPETGATDPDDVALAPFRHSIAQLISAMLEFNLPEAGDANEDVANALQYLGMAYAALDDDDAD